MMTQAEKKIYTRCHVKSSGAIIIIIIIIVVNIIYSGSVCFSPLPRGLHQKGSMCWIQ